MWWIVQCQLDLGGRRFQAGDEIDGDPVDPTIVELAAMGALSQAERASARSGAP